MLTHGVVNLLFFVTLDICSRRGEADRHICLVGHTAVANVQGHNSSDAGLGVMYSRSLKCFAVQISWA